jgi:hypothetical protein
VTSRGRPVFLKIAYHGPAAMEALARYDRSVVVGILGGSAGTTFDAFHMLWEAKKYGARVALFGRKINNAEDQLSFIYYLRAVADDQLSPEEAVKAYHGALQKLGIKPQRSLADDLQKTETASSYSGTTGKRVSGQPAPAASAAGTAPRGNGAAMPDFSKMTQAEKIQWNLDRWKRIVG